MGGRQGNWLSADKIEQLRQAHGAGMTPEQGARVAVCSPATAERYFRRWGWKPRPRPKMYGLPIYDGPVWIGKACRPSRH